jgi:homocysteine S-methyltransferase
VKDFLRAVESGVLVADGATGSVIAQSLPDEAPVAMAHSLLEVNLLHPELVQSIHLGYITAGADVISTNTFGASPARLARLGLAEQAEEILSNAVKIARDARDAGGRPVWIGGSIGPLDTDWVLDKAPSVEERMKQFEEQASILLDRGVDLLILETFSNLEELLLAVKSVRRASAAVPVVAQMSFDEHGELASGERAENAARTMTESDGIQVLGVNCSLGPQANLAVLEMLAKGTDLPLSIMPNAGFAQRIGGRVLYPDMSSGYYSAFAKDAMALGARIIGGCCGTTPEQIRTIRKAVDERALSAPALAARPSTYAELVEEELPERPADKPSGLMRRFREKSFVRSLQIDPQRGPSDAVNRRVVERILDSGLVDLVDINSAGSGARQDSLQVAAGIECLGIETLPHVTPRDGSVSGILAQVLGAYDWGGIRNVLVIVGDPPKGDLYAEAKGVYQVDSIGLVRALDLLRRGRRVNNRVTMPPFPLTIGVALNQNAPDGEFELLRLQAKIEAGADFAMTQPFFLFEDWLEYRKNLEGRFDIPVMVGAWPLISHRQALRINENVAGVAVPDAVCTRLEEAGPKEQDVGFGLAAELIAKLEESMTAAGVYVVAPFKQPKRALEVFELASRL